MLILTMAPNSHDISNDTKGIAQRNDTKDALIVLYLLSKGVSVLEAVRRGLQINMS
jgi:hypothetical protein